MRDGSVCEGKGGWGRGGVRVRQWRMGGPIWEGAGDELHMPLYYS